MTRIEQVRIQGYRRLRDVTVQVRPLTVLIGANGSGKTSYLEAWTLLAGACWLKLADNLTKFGGIASVLTKDRTDGLTFGVDARTAHGSALEYKLRLEPLGQGYRIAHEELSERPVPVAVPIQHISASGADVRYLDPESGRIVRPNWQFSPLETALAQVPKMFQTSEEFRQHLSLCAAFGLLDVSPTAPIRLPQPLAPADLPGPQGGQLVSCLYSLRETDRDRYEVLLDTISAGFPDFERLDFPPVAAGTLAMTWKDRNFSTPLYMHQLSEGTLRFLWIATTLLQNRQPITTLMIDEPEVSLHPELLRLLVDLMHETARRSNVVVATHSDRLIRCLDPSEVLVADVVDGMSRFTWGDELDLAHWLSDYSLDQLWQMGVLGGRA